MSGGEKVLGCNRERMGGDELEMAILSRKAA